MEDIIARIDALLANTPQSEIEEFEVTRCLRDCRDELIAASTLTGVMLQGTGQRLAESMAERVMNGMTVGAWIAVSERLPPIVHRSGQSSDDVFVALQYPDGEHLLSIGYYSHSDQIWHIRTAKHGWQPSHWMPLPEPPAMKPSVADVISHAEPRGQSHASGKIPGCLADHDPYRHKPPEVK